MSECEACGGSGWVESYRMVPVRKFVAKWDKEAEQFVDNEGKVVRYEQPLGPWTRGERQLDRPDLYKTENMQVSYVEGCPACRPGWVNPNDRESEKAKAARPARPSREQVRAAIDDEERELWT